MPLALYMNSLALTETTMLLSFGKTSCQVRMISIQVCFSIQKASSVFLSFILAKWVLCLLSFMFQQITCITSGNSWQTTSTVHMTMAQSCIMEGELLFKTTELQHSHVTGTFIQVFYVSPIQICLLWRWRTNNNPQTRSLHSHWPARWTQFTWSS